MKLFIKILLLCFILVCVERFCRTQTGGFRLQKATTPHSYPFGVISLGLPPKEAKQPFYYLSSGVQSYVFLGEDKETVLKLFKHHHFGPSTTLLQKTLPSKLSNLIVAKREKRMKNLFESAMLAFEKLQDKTGVYYLHLGKTDKLLGQIPLYDNLGIRHNLDLDKTEFLLQKRAQTVYEKLHQLFRNNQIEEAISSMKDLIKLIETRSKLGIKNKDGNILENCGFYQGSAVEIDIGSFIHRDLSRYPAPHEKDVLRATLKLLNFVKKNYPDELPQCKRELIYESLL